ncbi:MAG: SpoIIE family protein phosphatase [Treponema sp.]|nr:SpoIIE family protein phosphatase [Treponema sp.]
MMLSEVFHQLLSTALPAKLFLEISLVILLRYIAHHDTDNIVNWAFWGTIFLIIRDSIGGLVGAHELFLATDIIIPAFIALVFLGNSHRKLVFVYGLIAISVAITLGVLHLLAIIPSTVPVLSLTAIVSAGAGLYLVNNKTEQNQKMQRFYQIRSVLISILIVLPPAVSLAGPFVYPILHIAVYPLQYLGFIWLLLQYSNQEVELLIQDRDRLSDNVDTLYNFVLNSSDALRSGGDLPKLMQYVAKTIAEGTESDGVLTLLVDDFEDQVTAYAIHGVFPPIMEIPESIPRNEEGFRNWLSHLKIPLGQGLIGEIAKTGKAQFITDPDKDSRIVIHPSFPIGSLIGVPFLIEERIIGVAILTRKKSSPVFTDKDFDKATLLAGFASVIINTIYSFQDVSERSDIDRAASIAEDIQKALRPKKLPKLPNLTFGTFSESAWGVYSDYYDVIPVSKERIYIVIGDVAGKGIQASLIMVMIRAILHLITNTNKNTATILSWINRGITGKIDIDHFATLQILCVNPLTGSCEYANAGHRPLLIWRNNLGLVDAIDAESVPIGVEKNTEFKSTHFTIAPEDVLIFYTDGVIEAINGKGKQYGIKSLTTLLHKFHDLSAVEIAQKIKVDIKSFMGDTKQHDDQTVLVVKTK